MARDVGIVQSVDRALKLLQLIAEPGPGSRLTDLASRAGLAVSTTHRLLTTLERRGFVQHDALSNFWVIGQRAHLVGESFSLHANLVVPARPILRQLRDATRETANLGVIEDEEAVTIAQAQSREIMRAISPPGGRVPALNSGMGKAIVATWPDEAIEQLVNRQGLRPLTGSSLRSKAEVFREVATIREQGYALDDEEYVVGMRCVAAVIWSATSEAIAAISVSGLAARVTKAQESDMAAKVLAAAAKLTKNIDGVPG